MRSFGKGLHANILMPIKKLPLTVTESNIKFPKILFCAREYVSHLQCKRTDHASIIITLSSQLNDTVYDQITL